MRVAHNMLFDSYVSQLNQTTTRLQELSEQAATQKRVNRPGDDPVGTSRILNYRDSIGALEQFQENISQSKSWLSLTDQTLQETQDMLARSKELAVQASNKTMSRSDREGIAQEIQQIFDQLLAQANTRFEGQSIFAGNKVQEEAYVRGLAVSSNETRPGSRDMEMDRVTPYVRDIQGESRSSIKVEFRTEEDQESAEIGTDEIRYKYSTDGGQSYSDGTLEPGETDLQLGDVTLKMHKGFEVNFPEEDQEGTVLNLHPTAIYQGGNENKPGAELLKNFNIQVQPMEGSFETPAQVRVTSESTIGDGRDIEYEYSLDQGATWSDTLYAENEDPEAAVLNLPGGQVQLRDASKAGDGDLQNLEFTLGGIQVQQTNTDHQAVAVGDFQDKVQVRIDEDVNMDLDNEISYSYSTDQGRTWSSGHKATNPTTWQEYAELVVPGGKLKLTGTDSDLVVDTGAGRSPSYLEMTEFEPSLDELQEGDEVSLTLAVGDTEETLSSKWDGDSENNGVEYFFDDLFSGSDYFKLEEGEFDKDNNKFSVQTKENESQIISLEDFELTRELKEDLPLASDDVSDFQPGDQIRLNVNVDGDEFQVEWDVQDGGLDDLARLLNAEFDGDLEAEVDDGELIIKDPEETNQEIEVTEFSRTSRISAQTEAEDGSAKTSSKLIMSDIKLDEIEEGQEIQLNLSGGGLSGEESYNLTWGAGDLDLASGLDDEFGSNFDAYESGGDLIIETSGYTGERIVVEEFRNKDTDTDLIGRQQKIAQGDQFNIQPRQAGRDTEISEGIRLQQNSLGPETFGGHYQNPQGLEPAFEGQPENNLFQGLGKLITALEQDDQEGIQEGIGYVNGAIEQVSKVQAQAGAKLNRLESTEEVLSNRHLSEQERKSNVEDVDFAELMSKLTQQQTIYQAVLKSSAMIMRMSLADYI